MSKEVTFCEECWGLKRVVICEKPQRRFLNLLFPDLRQE